MARIGVKVEIGIVVEAPTREIQITIRTRTEVVTGVEDEENDTRSCNQTKLPICCIVMLRALNGVCELSFFAPLV